MSKGVMRPCRSRPRRSSRCPGCRHCDTATHRDGDKSEVLTPVSTDDSPATRHAESRPEEHVAQKMTIVGEPTRGHVPRNDELERYPK
jgi:hypothetical protein